MAVAGVAALEAYGRCRDNAGAFRAVVPQLGEDLANRRMNKDPTAPAANRFRENRISAATRAFRALCNDSRLSLVQAPSPGTP